MKEATGELNMTVVTVLAIAAIGVLFYTLVWPIIKGNIMTSTRCSNAICEPCTAGTNQTTCTYYEYDDDGTQTNSGEVQCPCK